MPARTKPQRPATGHRQRSTPLAEGADFDDIKALATSLRALHRQMAAECAPVVEDLIWSRCRDHQEIERLLDRLLDCACIPEGLALFKPLCRYYFTLNPTVTANYVGYYREMWDSEGDEKFAGNANPGNAGLRTRSSKTASAEPRDPSKGHP